MNRRKMLFLLGTGTVGLAVPSWAASKPITSMNQSNPNTHTPLPTPYVQQPDQQQCVEITGKQLAALKNLGAKYPAYMELITKFPKSAKIWYREGGKTEFTF